MNEQDRHVKASALEMKMVNAHKQFLLSTLKVDRLPDELVLEYFRIKKYSDVLSSAISPMDMIMMADRCGLLVDEYGADEKMASVPAIIAEKPGRIVEFTEPTKTIDASGGEAAVDKTAKVESVTEEKQQDSAESPDTADGSWPEEALPKGTKVSVFHDSAPQTGEIVNVSKDEYGISYDIKMDNDDYDDPIPFSEKDIQVE